MKIFGKWIIYGFMIWVITGCGDDFLDDHSRQINHEAKTALYLTPESGYYEHSVKLPGAGGASYSIGMCPNWLNFKYMRGTFKGDSVLLKFTVQNIPATSKPGTYVSVLSLIIEDVGIYIQPVYMVNE